MNDFRDNPHLRPTPYMLEKPIKWPNFPVTTDPEAIRGRRPRMQEAHAYLQVREIAIRVYRHMKRTDIWQHFCTNGKNCLLYFIQRVDSVVNPMELVPARLRRSEDITGFDKPLNDYRATTIIRLAFEDLYYMTCYQLKLLYDDLKTRVSGLGYDLHWVMHQGGARAGPATEGHNFNMARMFWLLRNYWTSLQSPDLVGALDFGLTYEESEELIARAEWIRSWQPSHISKVGLLNINAVPPFAIPLAVWARLQARARKETDTYQAKFRAKMQNLPFGAPNNDIASLHVANAALGGALKEGVDEITRQARDVAAQRSAHLQSWLEDQKQVKKFKSAF